MVQVNLNPTDLYDNAKESGFLNFRTINQREKHWIRGKSGIENNRETLKVNKMAAGNTFKGVFKSIGEPKKYKDFHDLAFPNSLHVKEMAQQCIYGNHLTLFHVGNVSFS